MHLGLQELISFYPGAVDCAVQTRTQGQLLFFFFYFRELPQIFESLLLRLGIHYAALCVLPQGLLKH